MQSIDDTLSDMLRLRKSYTKDHLVKLANDKR